jgi:pyruvate/2-oxoglutarate dehydrogenase complex dihydrolipoamide dehydrogenase (E3) component
MQQFDHIILGTGQATGTLLSRLIPTGEQIAVVEGGKVGGSCVNYGCTPTKTLVASAKAFHNAQRGGEYGFSTGPVNLDFQQVKARMNELRQGANEGLTKWMESTPNVTLFKEWGAFTDTHTLAVGDEHIKGKHIYINTGTRATAPPLEGIDNVPWLDNSRLLDLAEVPEHLLIIGGGYIGMEFSQIFRRFGAKVTVVQFNDRIMPQEDPDVSREIQRFLKAEGVEILCNTAAKAVKQEHNGQITLSVERNASTETLSGSHLLIAAGRKPNSDSLNLSAAGIEPTAKGFIPVDDHCQTSVAGVFAIGDVNGHGAFTHTSVHDSEVVLDYLFDGPRKLSDRHPIHGLFTDPPLGRVGLSEKEALDKGIRLLKGTKAMKTINRAKEMAETDGFAKLLVDADTDQFVGATIIGPGADEIINLFAALMQGQVTRSTFRQTVLVHPTVSELMPWVLDNMEEVAPA